MAKNPSIEIKVDFEKGKQVESKLKKVLEEIQSNTQGLKITVDDVALQSQLVKIDEATKKLADSVSKNLNKISLSDVQKETQLLMDNMESLTKYKTSSSQVIGSNVVTDSTLYKNNMEQSLEITNKLNTKTNELIQSQIKVVDNSGKHLENQIKLADSVEKTKIKLNSKMDDLYKGDIVPKDMLIELDKSIEALNTNSKSAEIEKINVEIAKMVKLEKELKGQSKQQQRDTTDVFRKQKEVELTKELIDLERKNLNASVNKMANKRGSLLETEKMAQKIKELRKAINDLNGANTQEVRAEVKKLRSEIREIDTIAEGMGKLTGNKSRMSLFDGFKSTVTKMGLAVSLYELVGVTKQAINHVIELDSAMTDLKKVTDDTQQSYDSFVNKMHEVSMQLGTQTTQMVQMATYWAKTGRTLEESAKLAESSAMLLKVGDNNNVEEVMQSMVAPLTAFNIEAKNSIDIVDKFNNTSNNMAVTTEKLGDALSRSASSLATAGNDINQSMALISTAMAKTQQSSETIGTAMKSLSMRMATFKDDETGEPILKFAENMKKIGVEMYDVNGQIRSTYDILLDTSKVWGKLDRNTQMSTANMLGGLRQGNIINAIVSDTEALERAYELSSNSVGSAMEEHLKYTESIQYSLDRAKETIQALFRAIVSDSGIKTLLEGFTGFVNLVTSLIEKFGGLNVVIASVVTYMTVFNRSFQDSAILKAFPFLNSITMGFDRMRASIMNSTVATNQATFATGRYTAVTAGATIAQRALTIGTYALQMALTGGILLAITAVVTGLIKWADQAIVTKEELKKLNAESANTVKETAKSISEAESTYSKIGELQSKIANTSDMTERNRLTKELTDLQASLATTLNGSASGFDKQGRAISDNNALIEEQIRLQKQKLEVEAITFAKNNEHLEGEIAVYDTLQKRIEDLTLAKMQGGKITEKGMALVSGKWIEKEFTKEVDVEYLNKLQKDLETTQQKVAQTTYLIQILRDSGKTDSEIKALGFPIDRIDEFNKKLREGQDELDKLNNKLNQTPENALKDATKSYGDAIDKAKELNDLLVKVNKEQAMTPEIISELAKKYPELGANINNIAYVQDFLNKKILEQVDSQKKAYEQMVMYDENYYNTKLKGNEKLQEEIIKYLSQFVDVNNEQYKIDLNNYKNLFELKQGVMNQAGQGIVSWASEYVKVQSKAYETDYLNFVRLQNKKIDGASQLGATLGSVFASMVDATKKISESMPNFSQFMPSFNGFDGGSFGNSGGSKEEKSYKPNIDIFYELSNAIDDVNDKLDMNRKLQEKANPKDKIKLMEQEVALLKEQARLTQELTNKQIAEANRLKNEIAKQGGKFDKDGNLTNIDSLLNKTVTGDKAIEALKALEDKIKEYTQLTQDQIPKTQQEWQELQNTIKEVYETQAKLVADTEKQVFDTIKYFAEKATNKKKEEIDKQIALLNKARDEENQEDEMNKKRNQLSDLKAEMDKYALATDKQGRLRFEQLKKQYEEMQDELNKTIQDNQHNSLIDSMEEEKNSLDKALEDLLDPANVNKIIQEALSSGYVTINGQVTSLQDATNQMLQETTVGTQNLVMQQKEYVTQLQEAYELMKKMQEINGNLGLGSGRSMSVPNTNEGVRAMPQANNVNNNFTVQVEVKGNADSQTAEQVGKVVDGKLKEFAKKFK